MEILEFSIDETRYAVPLSRVLEVLPRVWLTSLPEAPPHVAGVFAYRGQLALVVDIRQRLGHAPRAPRVSDHLVLTRGNRRPLAVIADQAHGLRDIGAQSFHPPPLRGPLSGIVTLPEGLLLVDDLEQVLTAEDEAATERSIQVITG